MSLADKLKTKERVKWTTLRGEKIGLRILTRAEMIEHLNALDSVAEGDDRGVFKIFAEHILDDKGQPALSVDEMEEILTNAELKDVILQFNKANGLVAEEKEKN